jgi:hypothetical protein
MLQLPGKEVEAESWVVAKFTESGEPVFTSMDASL